jgi:hypothetical protein
MEAGGRGFCGGRGLLQETVYWAQQQDAAVKQPGAAGDLRSAGFQPAVPPTFSRLPISRFENSAGLKPALQQAGKPALRVAR